MPSARTSSTSRSASVPNDVRNGVRSGIATRRSSIPVSRTVDDGDAPVRRVARPRRGSLATPAPACAGMSTWRTPRWASASTTADCTAGVEPIVPDSPTPLAPSGLTRRRRLHRDQLEARQLGRADHRVVGEVRRDRVAVGVVAHLLASAPGPRPGRSRRAAGPRAAAG